jgi:RNA polymerase sigma-70 factor, ECF subfamily
MGSNVDDPGEREMIERARHGDREAFGYLYERYWPKVVRIARLTLWDNSKVDDVLQETFVKVITKINDYRFGKFRAWIVRIAVNTALDQNRGPWPHKVSPMPVGIEPPSPGPGPNEDAEIRDDIDRLRICMEDLAADQRLAIALNKYEGLSHQEIANLLKISPGTVRSRIARGMIALRRRFEERVVREAREVDRGS